MQFVCTTLLSYRRCIVVVCVIPGRGQQQVVVVPKEWEHRAAFLAALEKALAEVRKF